LDFIHLCFLSLLKSKNIKISLRIEGWMFLRVRERNGGGGGGHLHKSGMARCGGYNGIGVSAFCDF
jgi:hypothetical protein